MGDKGGVGIQESGVGYGRFEGVIQLFGIVMKSYLRLGLGGCIYGYLEVIEW